MHARTILPALLALATAFTHAATEFGATVPVQVVGALTRGGVVYQDLPVDFPPLALPAGILLMGSIDNTYEQKVLFRTALSGAASQEAMATALQAEGWQLLADPAAARQTGFVMPATAAATPPAPVTLCHDEFGNLQIRGEDGVENRVYVRRFNLGTAAQRTSCEEQNRRRFDPGSRGALPAPTEIFPFVPTLRSPRQFGLVPRPNVGITDLGSSSGFGINSVLRAPGWSVDDVREHYDAQIREQGWVPDAQWSGTATAGSHWTRSVATDAQTSIPLYLTFTVFRGTGEDFSMTLSLSFEGFSQ